MTPRALLTAIAATAMAFTIAIGVAAESTADTVDTAAEIAQSTGERDAVATADARLAAWIAPCEIAV